MPAINVFDTTVANIDIIITRREVVAGVRPQRDVVAASVVIERLNTGCRVETATVVAIERIRTVARVVAAVSVKERLITGGRVVAASCVSKQRIRTDGCVAQPSLL